MQAIVIVARFLGLFVPWIGMLLLASKMAEYRIDRAAKRDGLAMWNTVAAFRARYDRANYNARGRVLLPRFIAAEIILFIVWIVTFLSLAVNS